MQGNILTFCQAFPPPPSINRWNRFRPRLLLHGFLTALRRLRRSRLLAATGSEIDQREEHDPARALELTDVWNAPTAFKVFGMPHERAATELRGRAARPSGRPVSPCLLEPSPSPWSPPLPTATSSTSTSRSPSLRPPPFTPPAQRTWRRPAGRTAPSGATSPSPATESASLFQPATLSSRPCPAAPAATSAGAAANAAARGHSSNATARASRGCSPTASTSTSRGRPSRKLGLGSPASEPSSALARISGLLADRIDVHVERPALSKLDPGSGLGAELGARRPRPPATSAPEPALRRCRPAGLERFDPSRSAESSRRNPRSLRPRARPHLPRYLSSDAASRSTHPRGRQGSVAVVSQKSRIERMASMNFSSSIGLVT